MFSNGQLLMVSKWRLLNQVRNNQSFNLILRYAYIFQQLNVKLFGISKVSIRKDERNTTKYWLHSECRRLLLLSILCMRRKQEESQSATQVQYPLSLLIRTRYLFQSPKEVKRIGLKWSCRFKKTLKLQPA